jgi:hypothetical protein
MKDVLSLPSDFIGNETAMHGFFQLWDYMGITGI